MKLKSKKGFTLVELIIVIAILGIIALIAVPSLTGVQKRSQVNADKRTAEQIGNAVRIWLADADINEARKRETDLQVSGAEDQFVKLSNLKTGSDGLTCTTGLEDYISLDYAPNVTDSSGNQLAFYVGLVEKRVVVVTGIDTDDEDSIPCYNSVAKTHKLNGNATEAGIAYVEGISELTPANIHKTVFMVVDNYTPPAGGEGEGE